MPSDRQQRADDQGDRGPPPQDAEAQRDEPEPGVGQPEGEAHPEARPGRSRPRTAAPDRGQAGSMRCSAAVRDDQRERCPPARAASTPLRGVRTCERRSRWRPPEQDEADRVPARAGCRRRTRRAARARRGCRRRRAPGWRLVGRSGCAAVMDRVLRVGPIVGVPVRRRAGQVATCRRSPERASRRRLPASSHDAVAQSAAAAGVPPRRCRARRGRPGGRARGAGGADPRRGDVDVRVVLEHGHRAVSRPPRRRSRPARRTDRCRAA